MTRSKRELSKNIFPSAREDAATSRRKAGRYSGNAYRLAFTDTEFLLREEMRPVRIPEGAKPERLRLVGWVQDAQGRVVAAAQSRCQ